jgi:tetratricopeptide (TPR) repeat protein
MHLGLAIDFQTRAEEQEAADELKKAMDAGLSSPAAYFNLGLLYFRLDRKESAQRNLARAVSHPDYAIASRLMIGQFFREKGMPNAAVTEYLEALKLADIAVVQPEMADILHDQYEPLIEAHAQEEDEESLNQLCDNIEELLMQPNWRQQVTAARAQLPSAVTGSLAMPIAEILTQAESTEMVQAMGKINDMARKGFYRTAMEEAFYLMSTAPTYLPLHIQMGELLLRQERSQAAIAKFTIVANTYASRGEANRATDLLRRIVEIAPLDMKARNRLINTLIDQGQVDVAITEYLNLADAHYRLAQLDTARATYENALRLAQQGNTDPSWGRRILHYMADIDLQRLDWRQALRVYEQLRTLGPDDEVARKNLVELNMRLGQETQASAELDNYLNYLSGKAQDQQAASFLEKIAGENPEFTFVHRRLAQAYQQASRSEEAISHWDKMAQLMVQKGDSEGAKEAIRSILVLNPPNAEKYRAALQKLD